MPFKISNKQAKYEKVAIIIFAEIYYYFFHLAGFESFMRYEGRMPYKYLCFNAKIHDFIPNS